MHNKPVVPIYLRLFVPLAILGLIGVYLYGRAEIRSEMTRQRSAEVLHIGLGSAALTSEIAAITRDLHVLSGYSALREATEQATPTRLAHVGADFANFSEHQRRYDQVRWIDETGMERLRVDYFMGKAVIVAQEQLQNKGQRYYFTDSFKLKPGEVYVSPLDLNIEHDKVELPYKPMLRLATPVTDSRGVKRGIVILNYNGRELLDSFAGATGHVGSTGMLVNSEGYWLKGAKSEDEWGFMFNRPDLSLAVRSAAAWARIRSSDSGQELLADGLWTWQSIYPLLLDQKSSTGAAAAFEPSASALEGKQYVWKAASHVSVDALGAVERLVWRKLALVGVVLLAVFGLGSWKLTQAWRAAAASEAKMRELSAGLERQVQERTRALSESEGRFRTLTEGSLQPLIVHRGETLLYANAAAATMLGGKSAQQAVGKSILDWVRPDTRQAAAAQLKAMAEQGHAASLTEQQFIKLDGSTIDVEIRSSPIVFDGAPAFQVSMQDITDKKKNEAKIQRYVVQLEGSVKSTIEVAMTLSEMRDPYTAGHARRVAELAGALGGELGLDPARQEGLRVAGHLHDVGKMTIPAEILSRPGKLSALEFALIKTHAQSSYDVLKTVQWAWPVAEVALQHHERIDGSGYPQGLKGEEILLEARILAVADVVEAMSSHRPYRSGLGIEAALAEIERGRGSAYDPVVADVCLKLFREQGYTIST